MESQGETAIRDWMLATISNGGIERLDDLHVDQIFAHWKARSSWMAAGLTAYASAVRLRRELGLDVTVALGFSLVEAEDGTKEAFENAGRI
jgi:hypothetical protein